ncbi:MAG TPA: (2Fe-2S)-binding protein [Streptosporangiaceae bacterium]|nr:(2Fe-2S)-binding protein [Streptosporangiaceae bacterium]
MTDRRQRTANPGEVRAALRAAASLGMFFRLADPGLDEAGWQPAGLLYASGSGALDAMLDDAAARLGGCERRVAASLLFQGYAARLLSPQVGCLVTSGCVPAVPAASLRWRRPDAEVVELGLEAGTGWLGPADVLTEVMLTQSFHSHLRPLADAVRARVRIPATVLRDNAASALVGALRLADDKIGRAWRPGWRLLAEMALAHPRLRGSGTIGLGEPAFVRRSCCLYYRVDNGGLCGDCPLAGGAVG